MIILSIESSCDETAAAIISGDPFAATGHPEILSNVVVSQIDIFKAYGGVIPEVAARSHLEAILPVIHQAFKEAHFTTTDQSGNPKDDWDKIDAIAVTHTPGLLGSLLIGTLTARALAILHDKPLYAVHHLKSHIYSNWLEKEAVPIFPLLALVISGGHTQIIRMTEHNHFEIIGTTYDDAVGECFDKVTKILGLPYPGGPSIAKAAKNGGPKKYRLPHPQIKDLDFSFSGLKTAVLRAVQKEVGVPISYPSHQLKDLLSEQQVADFAASFEQTACEILLEKLEKALEKYPDTRSIVFAGGVSANNRLREECLGLLAATGSPRQRERTIGGAPVTNQESEETRACSASMSDVDSGPQGQTGREAGARGANNLNIHFPKLIFSGDNAAMVGAAAFYEIASGVQPTDPRSLNILPRSIIK